MIIIFLGLLVLLYSIYGWMPNNPFFWNCISSHLDDNFDFSCNSYILMEKIIQLIWRISWSISGASILILYFFYDSVWIILSPILIPIIVGIAGYVLYAICIVIFLVSVALLWILIFIGAIFFGGLCHEE